MLNIVKKYDFDNKFMQIAIGLAKEAFENNEVPVGCVISERKSSKIIAMAKNSMQAQKNPNAHAEILAINEACIKLNNKNLSECDIYTTLEPCTMCASAIANARLGRLYYGSEDTRQGAVENGVKFFASNSCFHRPEIYSGINYEESSVLMKSFFSKIRNNSLYS